MNLPDFRNHDGLNDLRSQMGASFRLFEADLNMEPDAIIKGFDSITIASDGTLEYKNEKIILYIRDPKGSMPKYHIVDCKTLRMMRNTGKQDRYVVTRRTDGRFILNFPPGNLNRDKPETYRLDICTNCRWHELKYNCAPYAFPLANWFKAVDNDYEPPPKDGLYGPHVAPETAPPSNYPPNWKLLSLECRNEARWKCDECGINLKFQPRFLHAHHKWGVRYNRPVDLRALCIGCHAEQLAHGRMKGLPDYLKFMELYGRIWRQKTEK